MAEVIGVTTSGLAKRIGIATYRRTRAIAAFYEQPQGSKERYTSLMKVSSGVGEEKALDARCPAQPPPPCNRRQFHGEKTNAAVDPRSSAEYPAMLLELRFKMSYQAQGYKRAQDEVQLHENTHGRRSDIHAYGYGRLHDFRLKLRNSNKLSMPSPVQQRNLMTFRLTNPPNYRNMYSAPTPVRALSCSASAFCPRPQGS